MSADKRLEELGFQLPPAPSAVGVYKPALVVNTMCYTSGHLPLTTEGEIIKGCIGKDADQDAGYQAATQAGLTMLSTLQSHLGSLDRIKRVVKLFGMVYCTDEFTQHPAVINGCSELMSKVFGDELGIGTRSAVGVASLPLGAMVEIEGIFELND